jgi:phosphoglycerate kinase
LKTIEDLAELRGKIVLLRSDLNVPLEAGSIADDRRVRASIPTIAALCERGAAVVILAHLGRPAGEPDPRFSLAPVGACLAELLGKPVAFATDTVGSGARETVRTMGNGDVVLLENVRFNDAETSKDDGVRGAFADELASLGDIFVSDGFGVVHRKQASVYDLARRLPHAAGRLVVAEVDVLSRLAKDPDRPYVVVLGGSKVSDKLGVIQSLLSKADRLLIGGGMVFTFLRAQGYEVGASLLEPDQVDTCRDYLGTAAETGVELLLPSDIVVAPELAPGANPTVVSSGAIPADQMGLDIGPESARAFAAAVADARTVFWNGPMGVFEFDAFASGTRMIAEAISDVDGLTVVGGGDSAAAVRKLGFEDDRFGHISTGGGASLEYLEGRSLPGLEVLSDN